MWDILASLSEGIGTTVAITLVSLLIGAVVAIPLTMLRRSRSLVLRWPAIVVVEVVRAIPPIVWLFIIYYALGADLVQLSTFEAAVSGLGLIAAAHLSEIYRAGLEAVPAGQWEAAKAVSLPALPTFRSVILPQAVIIIIPPAATFAIGLLKDSAVASVIGAHDIAFLANSQTQQDLNGLGNFAVAGLLYIVLSIPVAVVARGADSYLSRRMVSA